MSKVLHSLCVHSKELPSYEVIMTSESQKIEFHGFWLKICQISICNFDEFLAIKITIQNQTHEVSNTYTEYQYLWKRSKPKYRKVATPG